MRGVLTNSNIYFHVNFFFRAVGLCILEYGTHLRKSSQWCQVNALIASGK